MKKLSLLISLILCVTIGAVYANWVYSENNDVADETVNMSMNLTGVTYAGAYGTYSVDTEGLSIKIDPKVDGATKHITSLVITGKVRIVFTPGQFAGSEIEQNGVPSTWQLTLSNSDWKYDDGSGEKNIIAINHPDEKHDITWTTVQGVNGLVCDISAQELASHLTLTEFDLPSKSDYDAYNGVLANGQILFTVSDGIQTGQQG